MLLKILAKSLLLPPVGLLLMALVGVLLRRRLQRVGQGLALTSITMLLLISTPAVADFLLRTLHPPPPFSAELARDAGAVVIFGGGKRHRAPEYMGDTVSALTLERVRYGARVAVMTGLPLLVSGGNAADAEPEAVLMQRALQEEFHVRVRWIEDKASNTHENAILSARILKSAGVSKVVLVMHAFDMRRAAGELADAGIEAVPAPVNIPGDIGYGPRDWLPTMAAMNASHYAIYELVALAVRRMRTLAPAAAAEITVPGHAG